MAPRSQVKRTSNYFYDAFYFAENLKSTSVPLSVMQHDGCCFPKESCAGADV